MGSRGFRGFGVGGMGAAPYYKKSHTWGAGGPPDIPLKYGPPKAVDREFIYKIFARNPRDPKIGIFYFFTRVLGSGMCLDAFIAHFSSRYTPSEPKFSILDPLGSCDDM